MILSRLPNGSGQSLPLIDCDISKNCESRWFLATYIDASSKLEFWDTEIYLERSVFFIAFSPASDYKKYQKPFTSHTFGVWSVVLWKYSRVHFKQAITQETLRPFIWRDPSRSTSDPQILLSHENKHRSCPSCDFTQSNCMRCMILHYFERKREIGENLGAGIVGSGDQETCRSYKHSIKH